MDNRISKEQMFLDIAKAVSKRSTCLRRHVGSCIVDVYGNVVSTGYNGCAAGMEDCSERGFCWREYNGIQSGEQYEMCFAVHAEQNSLIQSGRASHCADMYLYTEDANTGEIVEMLPCLLCSRLLINAYISTVNIALPNGECRKITPEEIYEIRHLEMGMY